ncbi:calponin-likey domain-containing protein [Silurus asotus]|uniref:Calponin-likey domain-containing protein n=1 Tax=Silurus asotus TaxID=30991 RepID=A0AAD5FIS7_SILAS|nr:calponin-likey domain-containing protein [Silurus asotus]
MERKMMNLGRAKKKLRYFQSEDSAPCQLKIKDVFSMRDLDNIFDDLDSDPGTPLLSPLPKSPELDKQNKGSQSPPLKTDLHFGGEISPLKSSDVLAAEVGIQTDHLNFKGSPLDEIAPIKTSSPIELLAVEVVAEDGEKSETSPLLFGIEDEEPVVGDLSKPQINRRSEITNCSQGDSQSLASPPARLEFGKPTKQNDPLISSTPIKSPEKACKSSAPEPEEPRMDGHLCLSPVVLIQNCQPEPLPEKQVNTQGQEVAEEVGVKQSLFQKKLRNSLQPKASGYRKQETLKQPARAPSPHVQEEDFMILEDDSPIRFIIPRKTEIKEKSKPENGPVEPDLKEKASPKQTKEAESHKDEPKKKTKAKRGKAIDMTVKDTVVQSVPEEREDEVNEDLAGGEQICLSPDTNQDADKHVTGKQRPKGKTFKSHQYGSKDENDGHTKIPAEKPTAKRGTYDKLTTETNTGEEEPVLTVQKKPAEIKSAKQAGEPEATGLISVNPKKQGEDRSKLKNKKQAKEHKQVSEVQNHTDIPPDPAEQSEAQSKNTVTKANKEPASKQRAPRKPAKEKMTGKSKEVLKKKELPVPEVKVSEDASANCKRKRKPPGDWWLTQQNENNMQEQQEAIWSSQELKKNRKTQRKSPVLTDSTGQESSSASQVIQNETITVKKLPKKGKKSQSNPADSRKKTKSAGGRRKPKSGSREQHEMMPVPLVEEEAIYNEASGQLSPVICSRSPRQHSVTPGNKRVFDKIYTREGQSGSAQKCPPRLCDEPERVPVKRQRKPPRNWWEVPQSQEHAESSQSPRNSPQTSRPPMDPLQSAFHRMDSLQKMVGRGQNKKRMNMINTPKSVRGSLATFNAIYDSGKPGPSTESGQGVWQKGRRNLLHSLEDQSEHSSEHLHNDDQQQASGHATFDVCVSGVVPESSALLRKTNTRALSGSNRASDYDFTYKSGPSSLIELERYEEHDDVDLPSSRITPETRYTPRVLADCDLCGPPLKPIVLDNEDWDNLCVWFTHIWPTTSKDSKGISPDDFHWHCHAGRAMGHMIDLQNNTFSSGKILLGSYMKKPAQLDLNVITVFNVASSCVRVEIDGTQKVYNSGLTFMTPCGQSYSIHNMCQEPAVLWYHRMLTNRTTR